MEHRTLGKTGLEVSVLGFGASPLGNVFDVADEKEGVRAVHYAIANGINFFDVSPFYGLTLAEERLGRALAGKRQEILLATKCGRYGLQDFNFSYNRILKSIDESLARLKTDYVDVLQLHDIEFVDKQQLLQEAIPAVQKIKKMGKARFIGITGLPVRYLAEIARQVELDTMLSWAHYNLLADEINDELVPLSQEKGFGLMNAAPLMQRILSDAPLPDWHRSPQAVKDVQPKLLQLCASYGVNLSDVAIKYAVDHLAIATTIVGMSETRQVQQNLKALDLQIPADLLEKILKMVAPVKNQMWYEGRPENNIPKK
ncbi:aldo/keto reductase [Adhaeribacter pallidiroseus]|uniref:D-threo-aldose 1-dehydrogenase n=1 Tax=Adhaeribacter pallidiroseus TaxID=2072847 RepID=A0A369QNG1_9BACT|nr:aldo/keto reductase [Adhaeribacter pallidiroseus]RDC65225.1 D-threo-aldose 1-dehydrogenase [Adhaeribacter pallidiroseus]